MPLPRSLARFNARATNQVFRLFAGRVPGSPSWRIAAGPPAASTARRSTRSSGPVAASPSRSPTG